MIKPHTPQMYIHNQGFVALILVLLISAALFAAVFQQENNAAALFDAARHRQDRVYSVQAALFCFDKVILELIHDPFYTITSTSSVSYIVPISVSSALTQCSIVSVTPQPLPTQANDYVSVVVTGSSAEVKDTISLSVRFFNSGVYIANEKNYF